MDEKSFMYCDMPDMAMLWSIHVLKIECSDLFNDSVTVLITAS
jgi:hypothetical protein